MKQLGRRLKKAWLCERAAAGMMAAIFLALVGFGMAALVIDLSMLYTKRAQMVTAADAGALAAVGVIREEVAKSSNPLAQVVANSPTVKNKAKIEAIKYALANGAEEDQIKVTIEFRNVKLQDGTTDWRQVVEVETGVNQSNIFARFLNDPDTDVKAKTTATWGYVYKSTVSNFLPIFTFDKDYQLNMDILLHEELNGGNNYGYLDIGSGMSDVKRALAGTWVGGIYITDNKLDGQPGQGNSLLGPLEERFISAALEETPQDRRAHMMGLLPVISYERFNVIEENFKNKHGDWDAHLELPIEYFAYFEIIDVVKKNGTLGSEYALDPANDYKKVSSPRNYLGQPGIGNSAETSLVIGRFTGELVQARTLMAPGDQTNPGLVYGGRDIAAMYAHIID